MYQMEKHKMEKTYNCCGFLTLSRNRQPTHCKPLVFTRSVNNKQSGNPMVFRTDAIQILL